ncbi:MAG: hypothetical protein HRT89_16030, partial [Lentisphaeria bacterium]|nr:hypothetical protein [Lentisphaeria bacterium]NQZ69567.1 hypothetical protein [Lentisphaeria bacterium]
MKQSLLFVIVIILYFFSESLLRYKNYPNAERDPESKKAFINKLPKPIQSYIKKAEAIKKKKEDLENESDIESKIKILNDLASLENTDSYHHKIIALAGTKPYALSSWSLILPQKSSAYILTDYVDYIQRCEINTISQKHQLWLIGWQALSDKDQESKIKYAKLVAEQRMISPAFIGTYETLWMHSIKK